MRIENIAAAQASTEAVARVSREEAVRPPKAQTTTTAKNDESTASTVLKTVGLVTGVGPIVAGLMKLFGGSDSKPVLPALTPYSMPSSLSVDAGLSADRSITSIGYSQSGQARPETNAPAKQAAQTQSPIQITVQAMDSRSFMDHSDEIARAVRNAMLRSHSINDVVSEI
ncbi:MAG: hypothetical protein H7Y20_02195 [Bryobacteraceae bacterium]|nr:hypothetical protein [Bryobacteraceae bacterium]